MSANGLEILRFSLESSSERCWSESLDDGSAGWRVDGDAGEDGGEYSILGTTL